MTLSIRRYARPLALLGLLAFTVCVFSPCLFNGFTNWDAPDYLFHNPDVSQAAPPNIVHVFTSTVYGKYNPLPLVAYMAEHRLFGWSPRLFHLSNILLHAVNVGMVFALLETLGVSFGVVLFASAVFALHPLNVETVAWTAGLRGLILAFFYLAGLLCYARRTMTGEAGKKRLYFLSLLFFVCALLSKPTAVSFPLVLVWLDVMRGGSLRRAFDRAKRPFWVLAFFFGLAVWGAAHQAGAFPATAKFPFMDRFLFSGLAFLMYLVKSVYPLPLSCQYPVFAYNSPLLAAWVPAAVILVFYFVWRMRAKRWILFPFCFAVLTLWPGLHFFEVNDSLIYDRFFYLPSVGFGWFAGELALRLYRRTAGRSGRRAFLIAGGVLYFLFLGFVSWRQCFVWRSSGTLYRHALRIYPKTAALRNNLGAFYENTGRPALAAGEYRSAMALAPQYKFPYYNLGNILMKQQDYRQAVGLYTRTVALDPSYLDAYNNRANAYTLLGEYKEALADYNRVLKARPDSIATYANRGMLFFLMKRYGAAMADFKRVLDADPQFPHIREKIREILRRQAAR